MRNESFLMKAIPTIISGGTQEPLISCSAPSFISRSEERSGPDGKLNEEKNNPRNIKNTQVKSNWAEMFRGLCGYRIPKGSDSLSVLMNGLGRDRMDCVDGSWSWWLTTIRAGLPIAHGFANVKRYLFYLFYYSYTDLFFSRSIYLCHIRLGNQPKSWIESRWQCRTREEQQKLQQPKLGAQSLEAAITAEKTISILTSVRYFTSPL